MRRTSWRTLSVLLVIVTLSGCASIPTSGQVNAGIELGDNNAVELDILARGPQDGDSPEQILQGFLAAAASPQLDYRIAREFLTAEFSKEWKPDSGTTVDRAADRAVSTEGATASLRIRPLASVSDDGVYTAAAAGSAETRNYSLQEVSGQWRISAAPQGIVIDQATFGIVFGTYALQFFSPDARFMVPDVRWFALRETTQTAIVRAVVAGPVSWLQSGVTSAVPSGARLDADSVPISGSTATINLAVDTMPSADMLSRMRAQFLTSLNGVAGISAIELAINGTVENINPLLPAPTLTPRVDARPVVLTADSFGFLSGVSAQVEPISALAGALLRIAPDAIALGPEASFAAARTTNGIWRVTSSGAQPVWTGPGWLPPSVDSAGGIW
ncbi:MAG: GerMN domain-containing protein, partial [Agromyces sp.]